MTSAARVPASAVLARRILTAARSADLVELDRQLEAAEQLAGLRQPAPPFLGEQSELVGAIAGQVRRSMARFRQSLAPDLEGLHVHLRLLEHLATLPQAAPGAR